MLSIVLTAGLTLQDGQRDVDMRSAADFRGQHVELEIDRHSWTKLDRVVHELVANGKSNSPGLGGGRRGGAELKYAARRRIPLSVGNQVANR